MIGWTLACAEVRGMPPLETLRGTWEGAVTVGDGDRPAVAAFLVDDAPSGVLAVADPDQDRSYDLLEVEVVPPLGISLRFVERTGVRILVVTALGELPPIDGSWETKAFCGDPPDGWCREPGVVHLEHVAP